VAYLDHAAATPLRPEVIAVVTEHLEAYGNPSGAHAAARAARLVLDDAREEIGALTGTPAQGVVFTSGGTEADNWAVAGVMAARPASVANTIVVSAIEHKAVAEACAREATHRGTTVTVVDVDAEGRVDPRAVADLLTRGAALVSVMAANNELGTIQPVAEIAARAHRIAPEVVVHTDAVQTAPWHDLATTTAGCDLVTISGHKLGGLKGTGALLIRRPVPLAPLLVGGGQELGHRAGTQDALGAVAMATALRCAVRDRDAASATVSELRARLREGLVHGAGAVPTITTAPQLPGHLHVHFDGMIADELLFGFDRRGVAASAGSSCASGAIEQSDVLAAIGLTPSAARGAVRFTLGHTTTEAEVDEAIAVVSAVVERLRRRA